MRMRLSPARLLGLLAMTPKAGFAKAGVGSFMLKPTYISMRASFLQQ